MFLWNNSIEKIFLFHIIQTTKEHAKLYSHLITDIALKIWKNIIYCVHFLFKSAHKQRYLKSTLHSNHANGSFPP